jgi:hypothetical protein
MKGPTPQVQQAETELLVLPTGGRRPARMLVFTVRLSRVSLEKRSLLRSLESCSVASVSLASIFFISFTPWLGLEAIALATTPRRCCRMESLHRRLRSTAPGPLLASHVAS